MSSWGCPHEIKGHCDKVAGRPCDPGMKGCVLAGRYVFANEDKNVRLREKQARDAANADAPTPPDDSTNS
jgi:hypothetical protein